LHRRYVLLAATLASLIAAGPHWRRSRQERADQLQPLRRPRPRLRAGPVQCQPRRQEPLPAHDVRPEHGSEFSDQSPDGRRIAFHHFDAAAETPPQIWAADADGSHPRQLTDDPCGVADPAFSPDGCSLVVDACPGDTPGIFLIPAKSKSGAPVSISDAYRVTRRTDGGFDSEPQMSPDGRWIVFTRYSVECADDDPSDCQTRIVKVRTNGTGLKQLTGPELNASAPDYHPSGWWIAFDTHDNNLAPNAGHIVVMRADGSRKRIIVRAGTSTFYNNPSFSPDGTKVSYANWPLLPDGLNADSSEIWTAWVTGAGQRRLTTGAFDNKPDWGPRPRGRHHKH
jgi:Tol biopolymer transport system component